MAGATTVFAPDGGGGQGSVGSPWAGVNSGVHSQTNVQASPSLRELVTTR